MAGAKNAKEVMSEINPYRMPAGPEMDQLIQRCVMRVSGADCPPYSSDDKEARRVLARLKALTGRSVIVGNTAMRHTRWFARYETDPSDGTEVLAESLALAICRLALLHAAKDQDLSSADAS